MHTFRLLPASLALCFALPAHSASYTVFEQISLTGEYTTGASGATIAVPLGGEAFNSYTLNGTIRLEPFDPERGTLTDVRAIMSVTSDLTLSRLIVTEGTVGGTFDVDTRTNIFFDFPAVDERPFALGPPGNPNGEPLARPVPFPEFTTTLDRSASIPFAAGFIDIGGSKPTAERNTTLTSNLNEFSFDDYIDEGPQVFPPIIVAGIEFSPGFTAPDTVPVDVTLFSTTNLDLTCFGLGACQSSVTAEFETILGVQLQYTYTEFPDAVIPVPAAAWLFGPALIGLGGLQRNRRRALSAANTV